ncbi:endonuclease/exonuclease/phosphatase family protein [Rhodobacteraceae bacterium M385]|nr:endonuclease/exonuclease/phosphatase family protein [Rhodobacteraceae bacterium M385]
MDVPPPQPDHAGPSNASRGTDDPLAAGPFGSWRRNQRVGLCYVLLGCLSTGAAQAEPLRLASFHSDLSGRGPGLILRDILRQDDQIAATIDVIATINPDILALQDIDYDGNHLALTALAEALGYPHFLTLRPNSGLLTGLDLDGDGRTDGPQDAHGYGRFSGQGGMGLLSRYPLGQVQDFSDVLWADVPGNSAAEVNLAAALPLLRLHSVGAWEVEVQAPNGPFHVLMSHATTPVFDGPEDRNGLRNADETRFWHQYLDTSAPAHFAYMGTLNVDPSGGEGLRAPLQDLLAHPALQDPLPDLPTADWDEPSPGDLRVDYLLPSRTLTVLDAGVLWPTDGPLVEAVQEASDHRIVWVDVDY